MDCVNNYYVERLSAERLQRCYEIASQRIRQYLDAEVDFVLERISPGDLVLELGCGYGRVMARFAKKAGCVVGVDTSISSLMHGQTLLCSTRNCLLLPMDAAHLAFLGRTFDVVVCIQNGISAFHVDQERLIGESIRVAKHGGTILFSSYSERFWENRLEWFRRQSEEGLLGEIDFANTRDGVIVCKDGFTSSTVGRDRFLALTSGLNVATTIVEVDESSLFCQMIRTKNDI
ncbi:MAG: class I SAM-dependent methyltransferase [Bacteroidota bacterium]|jgi:2-polyprenyl-6-hydroxyphenyl methylase/3-demethylubiquinone-9 3-methyltransferase